MNTKKIAMFAAVVMAVAFAFVAFVPATDAESTYEITDITPGIVGEDSYFAVTISNPTPAGGDIVQYSVTVDEETVTSDEGPYSSAVAYLKEGTAYDESKVYTITAVINGVTISQTYPLSYTITIDTEIENGTISADKDKAMADETVTLTATPDEGYVLSGYTVTIGEIITPLEGATFTMPASNVTVSANFVKSESFEIKLTKLPGVEYYLDAELVSGTVKVNVGDYLTVKILFGYKATEDFAVLFDDEEQYPVTGIDGTYVITSGIKTVKVTGVEDIEFNEATITGKKKTISCGAEDKLTVDGTLTLVEGAEVEIYGELYVPAGATLVIEQKAALMIYGLLLVEGDLVINAADEDAEDAASGVLFIAAEQPIESIYYVVAQPEVVLGGTADVSGAVLVAGVLTIDSDVVVKEDGVLWNTDLISEVVVGKDATLTINGSLYAGTFIDVKGNIVFNTEDVFAMPFEADITNSIFIESGATVSILKYGACDGSILSISDNGMNEIEILVEAGQDPKADPQIEYDGKIIGVVSGLTITDSSKTSNKVTTYTIDVKGTPAVTSYYKSVGSEDEPQTVASADIGINGMDAATVTDSLVSSKNISLFVAGKLTVSGNIDLTADKNSNGLANLGKIDLSGEGKIVVFKKNVIDIDGEFNAVRYTVDPTAADEVYVYTTIDKALEQMNSDGNTVKSFQVMGEQTVTKSSTIPADVSVDVSGATLIIGANGASDVVLNVEASDKTGLIKGTNATQVIVNGTLYAEKKTNLNEAFRAKIVSDVVSMELNEKGQEVSKGWQKWTNIYYALTDAQAGDVIELSGDVNASKDLTIPAGVEVDTQGNDIIMAQMKELTIDGELCLQGDSKVVLNGKDDKKATIKVNGVLSATDDANLYETYGLAGAYYSVTEDDGIKYYCMSPVAVAAPLAASADDAVIDVLGDKLTIGSITLTGVLETEYSDAIIPVMNVMVNEFTAGTITLDDAVLNIVIGTFNGSVANEYGTVDLKVTSEGAIASSVTDKSGNQELTILGAVTYFDSEKDIINVETSGVVVLKDFETPEATLDGIVEIDGTVTVGYLYVPGAVAVLNEAKLRAEIATISGTLVAAEKTDSKGAATITAGEIYLGVIPSDVFVPVIANAAVLSGKVELYDYLLCDPSAELPSDFADENYYKSTTFYVDDREYLKAIVPIAVTASADIGDIIATKDNAVFTGWFDGIFFVDDEAIGDVEEAYAVFKYDIYEVYIKTDAGIKQISIGSKIMESPPAGENIFYLGDLVAGSYKVTYTLVNGYEGTAVLSTEMGTILKDNTITLSGTDETVFCFQLAGTEPVPEPIPDTPEPVEEDTGLSITDILLIILVILIAVMVIVLILKLNRS